MSCRRRQERRQEQPIKTLKFNLMTNEFTESVEGYNHLAKCVPKVLSQVKGVNVRRSIQAEMATGIKEKPASARVRIDNRVLSEYGRNKDFATIRSAACGNVRATQEGLARAKRKKFPNIRTYKELLAKENQAMHFTLRGMNAKFGDEHFEEKLLLYGDEDLLLFGSPGQLNLLRNCENIICDGTYKYAPDGSLQIYRIFGLVRGSHSTPLVTVLLRGKKKEVYKRMWTKVKEALDKLGRMKMKYANFDAESGAYGSFSQIFSDVLVRICSFHAKQGLFRKVMFVDSIIINVSEDMIDGTIEDEAMDVNELKIEVITLDETIDPIAEEDPLEEQVASWSKTLFSNIPADLMLEQGFLGRTLSKPRAQSGALTLKPMFLGERHQPEEGSSIVGWKANTTADQFLVAVAEGIVSNLAEMMPEVFFDKYNICTLRLINKATQHVFVEAAKISYPNRKVLTDENCSLSAAYGAWVLNQNV
uniref:MULE transposase domain-containing protein n=1 Tax=Ditylenchus dipsaci TaxID=166011 RepID=A0A915CR83_9BILA